MKSFKAAADACRLSWDSCADFSAFEQTLCRQSLRGIPTIKPVVLKVQT